MKKKKTKIKIQYYQVKKYFLVGIKKKKILRYHKFRGKYVCIYIPITFGLQVVKQKSEK